MKSSKLISRRSLYIRLMRDIDNILFGDILYKYYI